MSSAPVPPTTPTPSAANAPSDSGRKSTDRIIVYRHSNLFYWWPVWTLGFLFALITYLDDKHLAIVPLNTKPYKDLEVEVLMDGKKTKEPRHVLVLDKGKKLQTRTTEDGKGEELVEPSIYVTQYKSLGSVYVVILTIVIVLTNVSIRGLWTVFATVSVLMLTIILWAGGWWEMIFERLNQLSIYINMGGYLLISGVIFAVWFFNLLLFDRQTYMIFTPGQVRVRTEIGGEETVYDTAGMVVQRQRADLFRHWFLGFGSGDLVVKPVGLSHPIEFPNVLRVTALVAKIETMMKEKVIVGAPEAKPAT